MLSKNRKEKILLSEKNRKLKLDLSRYSHSYLNMVHLRKFETKKYFRHLNGKSTAT